MLQRTFSQGSASELFCTEKQSHISWAIKITTDKLSWKKRNRKIQIYFSRNFKVQITSEEINLKESYSFCSFVFVFSIVFSYAFLFAKGEGSGIFFSGRDGCLELKQEQSLSHSKALHRTCFSYITCHSLCVISNFRTYLIYYCLSWI